MKTIQCFNCGVSISRKQGNETSEHIPIQSLFEGVGDDYKINRITVPCCHACNNETSKTLDEEFRNAIAVISDNPALTGKTVKAMFQYKRQFDRLRQIENGQLGITFNQKTLIEYQKKVFKGLFYHRYNYPLPSNYVILVDFDQAGNGGSIPFVKYLVANFKYKHSGHPSIFKYILQPFRAGLNQKEKTDLVPTPDDKRYLGLLVFNQSFASMVYADPNENNYLSLPNVL